MSLCTLSSTEELLKIRLPERIDTANSPLLQEEIGAARASHPGLPVVLDAEELSYISSSGLRVILALLKAEPALRLENVGGEAYDTLEMTGFTELLPVERKYRSIDLTGCPEIARGAQGIIYRAGDDTIVKVFKSSVPVEQIREEREKARHAFVLGLPTAISFEVVKVGDRFGSVFELLDCDSMSAVLAREPERVDELAGIFAELLRKIHSISTEGDRLPDAKGAIRSWLEGARPFLTVEETSRLARMIDEVPASEILLHFDYHTNNVMMQKEEALLIDLDTLCHGAPIFELANIYVAFVGFGRIEPSLCENFLHLPYALSQAFWDKFLPLYLGSEDAAALAEARTKIELLSYLRIVRHFSRRWDGVEEEGRIRIERALALLQERLAQTDDLLL